jgi:hypothetical protein
LTLLIVATLACQVISTPAGQWRGIVIDPGSRAGIAGAQVTVVGERPVARTDAAGHFRWPAALPPAPMTIIVILANGQVARPIRLAAVQSSEGTLLVDRASAPSAKARGRCRPSAAWRAAAH